MRIAPGFIRVNGIYPSPPMQCALSALPEKARSFLYTCDASGINSMRTKVCLVSLKSPGIYMSIEMMFRTNCSIPAESYDSREVLFCLLVRLLPESATHNSFVIFYTHVMPPASIPREPGFIFPHLNPSVAAGQVLLPGERDLG